jgi:hypothetical protein
MESYKLFFFLHGLAWNHILLISAFHVAWHDRYTHHSIQSLAEMESWKLFCLGWPQTVILLISASHVARITGMSHQHLTCVLFSFRAWNISFHALLAFRVSVENSAGLAFMFLTTSLLQFSIFFLSSVLFNVLAIIYLWVFLFWFCLFGVLKASSMWITLSFSRLECFFCYYFIEYAFYDFSLYIFSFFYVHES